MKIKEFLELYKTAKSAAINNRQLYLNNTFNPKVLEEVIQAINQNPQLKAEIRLLDGATLTLKTVKERNENQTSHFYKVAGIDEENYAL